MNDSRLPARRHWRISVFVLALFIALAFGIHLLGRISITMALLVALLGFLANGILILMGERFSLGTGRRSDGEDPLKTGQGQ
jgi:hypothetical protein